MNMQFSNQKCGLMIETLEVRETCAGDITTALLGISEGITSFISKPLSDSSSLIVAGTYQGQPMIGSASLSKEGHLNGDSQIMPALADTFFGRADPGLDASGNEKSIAYIPGSSNSHPSLSNLNGEVVYTDTTIEGKIVSFFEFPIIFGLIEEDDGGQRIIFPNERTVLIPEGIKIDAILRPLTGETEILLGGTDSVSGQVIILPYHLNTGLFSTPRQLPLELPGKVKALTRSADGATRPVAIIELLPSSSSNEPLLYSINLDNISHQKFIAYSSGDKVFSEMGLTVFKGPLDWMIHVETKTTSNLIGIPMNDAISISDIIKSHGFNDVKINDVVAVLSNGLGRVYVTATVEIQGLVQTCIIAVVDNAPFQNHSNTLDVNDDGQVSPLDALLVINELIVRRGNPLDLSRLGERNYEESPRFDYFDVSGDQIVTPLDALLIISKLHSGGQSQGEGELVSSRAYWAVPVDDLGDELRRKTKR